MVHTQHTPTLASLEEAITLLFCLVDDTYALLNPRWRSHESLKKLSDSEVLTLALLEVLHPRQGKQSAGFDGAAWVRWGSFAVYGVTLHLLCATNRVPVSYELPAANVAEVRLVGELLVTRIVAKIAAYTYSFYVNRLLGRPQGRLKDLWA